MVGQAHRDIAEAGDFQILVVFIDIGKESVIGHAVALLNGEAVQLFEAQIGAWANWLTAAWVLAKYAPTT